MIRFPCPACKTLLSAPDDKVGIITTCGKCRGRVQVPRPMQAPLRQNQPARVTATKGKGQRSMAKLLLAAMVLLAVGGLPVAALYFGGYLSTAVPTPVVSSSEKPTTASPSASEQPAVAPEPPAPQEKDPVAEEPAKEKAEPKEKAAPPKQPEPKPAEPKASEPKATPAPPPAADEVPALIKQLQSPDEAVRLQAAKKLEKLGGAAKEAVPALTAALEDPDEDVRTIAARALAAIQKGSVKAEVAQLIKQLKDKDETVRLQAAKKLGQLGADAQAALPALTEALQDPDADVRAVAKKSITSIQVAAKGGNPVLAELVQGLRSKLPAERVKAAKELGMLGQAGRGATGPLLEAMMAGYPANREDFFDALEKINPTLHKPILTMLIDQNQQSRYGALAEIGKLGTMGRDALPALVGLYVTSNANNEGGQNPLTVHSLIVCAKVAPENEQIRQTVLSLLTIPPIEVYDFYANRADFYQTLGIKLVGRSASKELALALAAEMKIDAKQMVSPLVTSLSDAAFRPVAIKKLGSLGPIAKAAIPALNKFRFDANQEIREAATEALRLIQAPQ